MMTNDYIERIREAPLEVLVFWSELVPDRLDGRPQRLEALRAAVEAIAADAASGVEAWLALPGGRCEQVDGIDQAQATDTCTWELWIEGPVAEAADGAYLPFFVWSDEDGDTWVSFGGEADQHYDRVVERITGHLAWLGEAWLASLADADADADAD